MVHIIYITLIILGSIAGFVAGTKNADSTKKKVKTLLDDISGK